MDDSNPSMLAYSSPEGLSDEEFVKLLFISVIILFIFFL
jgi:hypothetical protein